MSKKANKFSNFKPSGLGAQPVSLAPEPEAAAQESLPPATAQDPKPAAAAETPKPATSKPRAKRKRAAASLPAASSPSRPSSRHVTFRADSEVLSAFDDLVYEMRTRSKKDCFDEALRDWIAKHSD